MPKTYFTICLDCTDKPCLMIGGDDEAFEKSVRFWEAKARLTVVSKTYSTEFARWLKKEKIPHAVRAWRAADMKGKFFAINTVKTDPELSKKIWAASQKENCLLSAYDQPEVCNIAMPALLRVGRLRLAISSNGAAPLLARRLRQSLQKDLFDREFADFSEWVSRLRMRLVKDGVSPDKRRRFFREMMKKFKVSGSFRYPPEFLSRQEKKLSPTVRWPGPKD